MEADAHPIGVHHPQGAVVTELVAVPHLIWRNVSGGGDGERIYPLSRQRTEFPPSFRGFRGTCSCWSEAASNEHTHNVKVNRGDATNPGGEKDCSYVVPQKELCCDVFLLLAEDY